ncbi:hypothetical protein ACFT25_00330 [Streptomyces hydrogenans]|uniref:hypothetical protein n=1 Tax=Streptomyces hydrogenans TaxID=1873719 RepID=UPI003631C258
MSDTPAPGTGRTGVWFVGARGSVATTAVAGAASFDAAFATPAPKEGTAHE